MANRGGTTGTSHRQDMDQTRPDQARSDKTRRRLRKPKLTLCPVWSGAWLGMRRSSTDSGYRLLFLLNVSGTTTAEICFDFQLDFVALFMTCAVAAVAGAGGIETGCLLECVTAYLVATDNWIPISFRSPTPTLSSGPVSIAGEPPTASLSSGLNNFN